MKPRQKPIKIRRVLLALLLTACMLIGPIAGTAAGTAHITFAADSSSADTSSADTSSADTSSADTSSADTFSADTFSADSSSADTSSADTSSANTSSADTSSADTSSANTSSADNDAGIFSSLTEAQQAQDALFSSISDERSVQTAESAYAASSGDKCGDALTWSLQNGVLTISGTGEMYNLYSPPWEDVQDEIQSVVIGSGVTRIGKYAFEDCRNLKTVTIGNGVTSIDCYAFAWCSHLESVTIGSNVSSIASDVFLDCSSLRTITVADGNAYYYTTDNVLFDKNNVLVQYPIGSQQVSYTAPDGTSGIGPGAFMYDESLESIVLPDSVTSIGDNAFHGCWSLTTATLGSGVTQIGDFAFYMCFPLQNIDFPDSLTRIGNWAFESVSFDRVTLGSNVTSIGYGPFNGCDRLTEISVSSDNTHFTTADGVLFSGDMSVLVQYPSGKPDSSYAIPDSVEEINGGAFNNCKTITSVSLPDSLKTIGFMAFFGCINLSGSLVIPDQVTTINDAFCYTALESVTVGSSVVTFSSLGSFKSCGSLKELYFKGNAPGISSTDFDGVTATIYYPYGDSSWNDLIGKQMCGTLSYATWDTPVIVQKLISRCTITLASESYTYDGIAKKPAVTVTQNDYTLINGVDYKLVYADHVNAGTATVEVSGIGNYSGSVTKSFTIAKADQTVTASLSNTSILTGNTAAITAAGKGTISYASSNPSVATVSGTGVVTAKAAGTATITVTAAGNANYNSASKKLTVNVTKAVSHSINLASLSYSFSNSRSAFGYSTSYRIPVSRYQLFFSNQRAQQLYASSGIWGGSCYGMATTSCMFNINGNDLVLTDFRAGASLVADLKVSDKNSVMNLTVLQLIEAMFVSQYASSVQSIYYDLISTSKTDNLSALTSLASLAKKVDSGGVPLVLAMMKRNRGGGHAIVGYRLETVSSTVDYLHVYDNNYPNIDRYIKLTKNSAGAYTSWYYTDTYNSDTYNITYIPYATYEAIWDGRTGSTVSAQSALIVSSDSFVISDLQGSPLAVMDNGSFESSSDSIYEVQLTDAPETSSGGYLIYLPTDAYILTDTSGSAEQLDVTMVNQDQTIAVTTQADTIELLIDDRQASGVVSIDGLDGELYEVTISSDISYAKGCEQAIYSGRCNGSSITLGSSWGALVSDNYTNSGVSINDTAVNYSSYDAKDISQLCDITLSDTSFPYTGEAIEPQATVSRIDAVTGRSIVLTEDVDYVTVYTGSTDCGTARVTVYGINSYKGKLTKEYAITAGASYGDVDLDGKLTAKDALSILQNVVSLSYLSEGLPQLLADVDHDGKITAADALCVLKIVVGLQKEEAYTATAD